VRCPRDMAAEEDARATAVGVSDGPPLPPLSQDPAQARETLIAWCERLCQAKPPNPNDPCPLQNEPPFIVRAFVVAPNGHP
jgi:hypothetical protein